MKKHRSLILMLIVMVAALAACLAACDKAEEIFLKAPADVYYDGQYLTWEKVENAEYYTVSVNGGDAQRVNSTTYAFASPGTDFDVTVSSVKGDTTKSVSKTFHPLATIEELNVYNDGSLWWAPVAGANAYEVQVNGQDAVEVTDATYDALAAGSNRVKVRPIVSGDNSFYSSWSAEKRVNIYATPTDIDYDGATLSWRGNGRTYEVTINGKVQTVTQTRLDFNSDNRDFDVTIKALGDYTNNFDSAVAEESFMYLDPVSAITVEDGILKWEGVEDAQGYRVKVGATVYTVTDGTQYDGLSAGETLTVSVMPYNDGGNYFSSWSEQKSVYILPAPKVAWNGDLNPDELTTNNITWDVVTEADEYLVETTYPDGKVETNTFNAVQYGNAFAAVGQYTVRVKATVADNVGTFFDSKFSAPITVRRLAAPTAAVKDFIVSNPDRLSEGFTVNFSAVEGAVGYRLYKGDEEQQNSLASRTSFKVTSVVADNIIVESSLVYSIQSTGGNSTVNGQQYITLDSRTENSLKVPITVLPTPEWADSNEARIAGGILTWTAAPSSPQGYTVQYGSATAHVEQGESIDLGRILSSAGRYQISVCTRGDGAGVLASNYIASVEVQRMDKPTGLKIVSANEGTIEFSNYNNENAYGGYRVFVGTQGGGYTEAEGIAYMHDRISTEGTAVYAVVVGDTWRENVYWMESLPSDVVQFTRLKAPTFSANSLSTQTAMTWNAPGNITSGVEVSYSVNDGTLDTPAKDGTTMSLTFLKAGKHTFKVKAIGDGVKFVDSEYSAELSFTKLETPTIKTYGDGYWWQSVIDATSYELKIDNQLVDSALHGVVGGEYHYMPAFDAAKTYTVSLVAVGNGTAVLTSGVNTVSSDAYTFKQKVTRLTAPGIRAGYYDSHGEKEWNFIPDGNITVDITTPSKIASDEVLLAAKDGTFPVINYQFEIGMSLFSENGATSFKQNITTPSVYATKAFALGGVFGATTVDATYPAAVTYYMSSADSQIVTITVLGSTNSTSFTMTGNINDGRVQWDSVSNVRNGYEYYIEGIGKDGSPKSVGSEYAPVHIQGNSTDITDVMSYRQLTIYVRAAGDSVTGGLIGGAWVAWTWYNNK